MHSRTISPQVSALWSALLPGMGEFLAGGRWRGVLTMTLTFVCLVWLAGASLELFLQVEILPALPILPPADSYECLPARQVGAAVFCLCLLWLWGIISAVDAVQLQKSGIHRPGLITVPTPPPGLADPAGSGLSTGAESTEKAASAAAFLPLWASLLSVACPGSGQLLTGQRRLGYRLFTLCLLAFLFLLPEVLSFLAALCRLISEVGVSHMSSDELLNTLRRMWAGVRFSLPFQLPGALGMFAAIAAADRLHASGWRPPKQPLRLLLILAAAGWACPGAGQLLQSRRDFGVLTALAAAFLYLLPAMSYATHPATLTEVRAFDLAYPLFTLLAVGESLTRLLFSRKTDHA